jgi:orotate phosphoribosyltransferase
MGDERQVTIVHARLVRAVTEAGAIRQGQFTLSSGRTSNYYVDLRKVTLSPAVGMIAGRLVEIVGGLMYDAIGGPMFGADPIVGACLAFSLAPRGFAVRKREKGHGLAGLVVGSAVPGDRGVIVEDVTTSGDSVMHAVGAAQAYGIEVVRVVAVLDRTGEVRPRLAALGIPFTALLTPRDFGIEEDDGGDNDLPKQRGSISGP